MTKKKIKILHILTRLIAAGADENTLYTVQEIENDKFESHLLVGGESEIVEESKAKGIKVIVVDALVRNVNPIKDIIALFQIIRIIKLNNYQIVHTHTAKAGFIGRIAAYFAKTPIIIHGLHGLSFHDFMPVLQKKFFILLEKIAGNFTDLFISVGENIKDKSISEGIGEPDKYVTIYSGMDLGKFENVDVNLSELKKSIGVKNDELVIGTVARLEPRKGPHHFIDVVSMIKEKYPNFKAVIVGKGDFRNKLQAKVKSLGLEDHVIFTGFRKDIAEVMSIFDIICLTSLWEGIPRVLIQGAKLGKPLIAFDIDGNSEIISEGDNGFLVPALDLEYFSMQLLKLIKDRNLRNNMASASRLKVGDQWDKNLMVKKIEHSYSKLCEQKELFY